MPSRRVTWGGKMVKLGHPSGCVGSFSDLSFAESFTQKRTQSDFSCLMELGEGNEEHKGWIFMPRWNFAGALFLFFSYLCSILTDDEDFESNWGIPDEPSDEMEMSRSSVTVRSFGDRYVSEQFCHQWSLVFSNLKAISDTNHLFVFIIERACGLPSVVQNSLYPLEMRKNAPLVCTAALHRDGLGAFYVLSSWDCAGRHSSCSGSDMYWCANLEESDYLWNLCGVHVFPCATDCCQMKK